MQAVDPGNGDVLRIDGSREPDHVLSYPDWIETSSGPSTGGHHVENAFGVSIERHCEFGFDAMPLAFGVGRL